jgi:cytochrome P450
MSHLTWPLLGNAIAFRRDATGFLRQIAAEQGDVARFRIGRRPAFLLNHPDLIRAVLVDQAASFHKGRLMQRARRLLGDGLLTSEGELHRLARRRIQPAFNREQIRSSVAPTAAIVRALLPRWQRPTIDLAEVADTLAMHLVTHALLGDSATSGLGRVHTALRTLARAAPLLLLPGGELIERIPLPGIGRLSDALGIVESTIAEVAENPEIDAPLLRAMQRGDPPLGARQLRDEVMTIFLAGHDTTAATLIWALLLLRGHPAWGAELRGEIDAVLCGRDVTADDFAQLPITASVIEETLRLYPPVGRIGRRPLVDVDLGVVTLPRDASVFVSPFVAHRDPRWYPDPEQFDPSRWRRPDPSRPRFAWIPFGAGPRSSIGEHFARALLVMVLATLTQHWEFAPSGDPLPAPRSLLTVKPRGQVLAQKSDREYAASSRSSWPRSLS